MPILQGALKADIDAKITNKTAPYSISNIEVGNLMKQMVDLVFEQVGGSSLLETIITTSDPQPYTIVAKNLLEFIVILPVSDCYPFASTISGTPGDVVPADPLNVVTATKGTVWELNMISTPGDIPIQISSVPVGSKLIFIKRTLY